MHFRCHELLFSFLKKPSFRSDILCSSLRQFKELDLPACEILLSVCVGTPRHRTLAARPLLPRNPARCRLTRASFSATPPCDSRLTSLACPLHGNFVVRISPRTPSDSANKPFSFVRQLCNPKLYTKPPPRANNNNNKKKEGKSNKVLKPQ